VTESRTRLALATTAAFLLQALPLPAALAMFRPPFAVLMVIFWSLAAPRLGGIALGFLVGLAIDVQQGVVLGQHALATSLVAYVAVRQHLLVRTKPFLEQSLFVFALLSAWVATCWMIEAFTGQSTGDWTRWLQALTGAVVWPLLMIWTGPHATGNR
jgi:rod shape-determining protein MreD